MEQNNSLSYVSRRKLYKSRILLTFMEVQSSTVTISSEEYDLLKKKAKIADDAIIQLHLSLEDLRHARISKF